MCKIRRIRRYVIVDVVGRVSKRVAWHYVYGMSEAVFTVFCKWYVGCGLYQAEKWWSILLDFVQGLAVLSDIGYV
jgi:hypothetical protein